MARQPERKSGNVRPDVPGLAARMAAARLLAAVIETRTSLDGLTDNEHGHPQYRALSDRDRTLVRAILATALRFRGTIAALIERRIERPLPGNATTLVHILHVAAAQILFLDVPDSAAVDLAVTHAKNDPRTARFAALVNGVLRGIGRSKEQELPQAMAEPQSAEWFTSRLTETYGAEVTKRILTAHAMEAPTDFTVKSDAEGWADKLGGFVLPTGGVRVTKLDGPVSGLPGYAEGAWWVQDAAAALPARLIGDVKGKNVADLCAAPGGKTAQLVMAGAKVTAFDSSKNRLKRLAVNLERLGMSAELVNADVLTYEPDGTFDAVLLDAPCSSTGTVRRHPDVPWTKSLADVEKLADLQERLLRHAIGFLRPGGTLVFSNCSLDPLEGEAVVARVLASEKSVRGDKIGPEEIPGIADLVTKDGYLRTTPADFDFGDPAKSGLDGFFAARLLKVG